VSHGQFSLAPAKFAFADVHAAVLDSSLTLSGSLQGFPGSIDSVSLSANGNVGQQSLQWAFTTFSLPPELTVNAPLSLSPVHVVWQKPAGISLSGTLTASDGPAISMDFSRKPEELVIHHATIKDQDSSAIVSFRHQQQATDFSFSGTLAQATLNRIFLHRTFGHGKIQGDLHASVLTDQPLESTLRGKLEGDDIVIPWGVTIPVRIDSFSLHADGNILTIESATVAWGASHFNLKGDVTASTDGFVLDMDLSSDGVEVDEIQRALGAGRKSENQKARPSRKPIIRGMVQFKSSSVTYGRYTFSPVKAIATLGPDGVSAAITEAKVCGIAIPGTLTVSHGDIQMGFKPAVSKQDLDPAMTCLSGADVNMTGTFNLNADISAQGKSGALLSSLEGKVNFRSKNGKIYRYPVLTKIFSLLSVTEIFRGRLPQLGGSGFPYHSMAVQGDLHQGKFTIEKAYIGGSSLDIIAQGDVDIAGKKMDLVVLVAPFSTINWIIRHIPLVGKMMGGTLISIPVKVSGDLADPDVTFLAPSAVGSRILELMKNIVELPVQIISPILPKEKEK
jgi:hypothetical protein